jgi:hypothetical protein
MKIWQYYNNCTKPAKEHGYDDEKRLQRELGDDERLKLRWNLLARQVEVWYVPKRSKPYCAYAIERPYNIHIIYVEQLNTSRTLIEHEVLN